jgi:bifunctional non-homologous end joining protein LigD
MTLEKYRQKRDIACTSEPSGSDGEESSKYIFVVQKHAARHLHYDFRLEMDGVLKSWAVPKGPSLDPAAKRLAIHVEDHSREYAEFEGTILEGGYGAGTVMVWDRGFWEPIGDERIGYSQGALKFTLYGEKLRGSWALVRMKNRTGSEEASENWLLIKERDEEAKTGSGAEITARMPDSALTGRTMEEIAANGD